MYSLTYPFLPAWLQTPVQSGHLSLTEASEIFDHWLLTPRGEYLMLPPHLNSAAQRLWLLEKDVSPTLH